MDTVMEDAPAGEYYASPDAMEGIEYHPTASLFGRSTQESAQQTLRRNLLSSPSLQARPTLQLSTLRDRQARRQQATRRWQPRPGDPLYHDMQEARADNRAEQRQFDRSHLYKRTGARFPSSSPKRTRTAYQQDTSDQRRVNATPRRGFDAARPLLDVTPPPPIDIASRQIRGLPAHNLLDGSPRLLLDAAAQPFGDVAPQRPAPVAPQPVEVLQPVQVPQPVEVPQPVQNAPQPIQMPQWPAALYRRATWRAAIPPWRRILVPVSRIAQLAHRTAHQGITSTIRTGLEAVSAFAHLFDRRDERPVQIAENPMAAPAPAPAPQQAPQPEAEPAVEPAAELDEFEEQTDPVSAQLQAELTGHTSQLPPPPSPPQPSPSPSPSPAPAPAPTPVEFYRPRRHLDSSANAMSEGQIIRMMHATASREAEEARRIEAAERAATQIPSEDESEADFEPVAQPQFALVPPLAPWVRSPIPFNPAVPQTSNWLSMSSPVIDPSPPVEEAPALDLAPPAQQPADEAPVDEVPVGQALVDEALDDEALVDQAPVDQAPVDRAPVDQAPLGVAPALLPLDENPALRLLPSSSQPIVPAPAPVPAPRPIVPPLLPVDETPALELAPTRDTPALGLSPQRPVNAATAQRPTTPSSRSIHVTPALRLMPSSSRPIETAPAPPPPSSPPHHDASSSRAIPDTPAARPTSSPSRRFPVTPATRSIHHLIRRRRGTPAPRRTTPRVPRTPLDADLEETRDLLSTVTVSGEDGIVPTRLQWWEADTPLGRPISAVRLFSSDEPPSNISDRTAALNHDEYEEMQREARVRAMRERTMALSRQRVPEGEAAVRPLTERLERQVDSAMSAPGNRSLGSTLEGAELNKQKLLTCYQTAAWLNDEVINGHLALTVDYLREKAENKGRNAQPKYHAFSSFFYSKLRDRGYKEVSRWARRAKIGGANLLDVETVFVPVHQQSHWTLLVVSPVSRTIEYFDSMGSRWQPFVDTIREWLQGELGEKYVEDEWTVLRTPSPKQDNGSDCGVFLLTTAKAVALGLEPIAYGPGDVPLLRKKIVAELLNSGFRGDLDPTGPGPARL